MDPLDELQLHFVLHLAAMPCALEVEEGVGLNCN